jgi:cysteine desulfurase
MDFAATTPMIESVRDVYLHHLSVMYGNASGRHAYASTARSSLAQSRAIVADSVQVPPSSIYFTASATESINLVLRGVMGRHPDAHIIASATEHKAVLATLERLALSGLTFTLIPPRPNGAIHVADVMAAVRPNTKLVCSMLVNNETGIINDVAAISLAAAQLNVPTLCDASQALGRTPMNMTELGCAALVLSSHKSYGPLGVSALCMHSAFTKDWYLPSITGGSHQSGVRAGTENVPAIAAFAFAVQQLHAQYDSHVAHTALQRDTFEAILQQRLPQCQIVGHHLNRAPHISTVILPLVDGELMLARTHETLAISSGSACNSYMPEPSHVLTAMGISRDKAQCSGLISFCWKSSQNDAVTAAHILADEYETVMMLISP